MAIFEILESSQRRSSIAHTLTSPIFWYWTCMLIAAGLFVNSLLTAGPIWDEPDEFGKLTEQLAFARDVLFGSTNRTFRSIPGDRAFYGIGTLTPAYALS